MVHQALERALDWIWEHSCAYENDFINAVINIFGNDYTEDTLAIVGTLHDYDFANFIHNNTDLACDINTFIDYYYPPSCFENAPKSENDLEEWKKQHNIEEWDYCREDIKHIIENGIHCVLVEFDDDSSRFLEIPEDKYDVVLDL